MKNKTSWLVLLSRGTVLLFLLMVWGWGSLAIFFAAPGPDWVHIFLTCLFAALLPTFFILSRSFKKGIILSLILFAALLVWWRTLQPTNDKEWAADVARIAFGKIQDNKLIMHNVRNFRYNSETDFVENWETREYNLSEIQGLDMFLSYWASEHIAHAIMSWDFGQDRHLAISIETRKDSSQEYSTVKGFFKQFELSYVAADEKDIIRLRTNYRRERIYAYRLLVSKEKARALLEDYLRKMKRLVSAPEFYDALTRNCVTTIHLHTKAINPDKLPPMDWRIIASGHLDQLLYEKGVLNRSLPFVTLRKRSRIDQRMKSLGEDHFSRILRYNLPKN